MTLVGRARISTRGGSEGASSGSRPRVSIEDRQGLRLGFRTGWGKESSPGGCRVCARASRAPEGQRLGPRPLGILVFPPRAPPAAEAWLPRDRGHPRGRSSPESRCPWTLWAGAGAICGRGLGKRGDFALREDVLAARQVGGAAWAGLRLQGQSAALGRDLGCKGRSAALLLGWRLRPQGLGRGSTLGFTFVGGTGGSAWGRGSGSGEKTGADHRLCGRGGGLRDSGQGLRQGLN